MVVLMCKKIPITTANAPNPNSPFMSNADGKMYDVSKAPMGVMSEKMNNASMLFSALWPDIKNNVMSITDIGML